MKMTELFLAQLEREAAPTRRVLERVPEGKNDWKPHARSMPLGYLAALVATMPAWLAMIIDRNEHDLNPPGGSRYRPIAQASRGGLLQLLDESVAAGRQALGGTTDAHLLEPWRLLYGGQVMSEQIRHIAISDSVFSHLAHHRGQLTVYLRQNDAPVPSVYGPSADDRG